MVIENSFVAFGLTSRSELAIHPFAFGKARWNGRSEDGGKSQAAEPLIETGGVWRYRPRLC